MGRFKLPDHKESLLGASVRRYFIAGLLVFGGLAQESSHFLRASDKTAPLMAPEHLALELRDSGKPQSAIFFVGFPVLYKGGHIPQAIEAGPASKAEGLSALQTAAAHLSRDARLVIYCGCCPFSKCPNVRPAYAALHAMGFKNVQILELVTNFHTDWTAHGYPVAKGS